MLLPRALVRGGLVGLMVWGVGLVVVTERRLPDWQDEVTIWRAAVAANPDSSTSRNTLGTALLERGRGRDAEPHFRAGAVQRPERLVSHIMLGLALESRGAHAEAEVEWALVRQMAAERFRPGQDPAVTNRGDMIQGVVLPPQPNLDRYLGLSGAAPDALVATR